VGGSRFAPDRVFTRSQIAAVINRTARVLGVDTEGYSHGFSDVKGHWVDSELGWPAHADILRGTDTGKFGPDGPLTTEQAIAITYRAWQYLTYDTEELGKAARLTFRDPYGVVILDGSQVSKATANIDNTKIPVSYYVALEFKPEGVLAWSEATSRLIGQRISICLDGNEISSPTVQSAITDGSCVITGLESYEYAKTLADAIRSDILP